MYSRHRQKQSAYNFLVLGRRLPNASHLDRNLAEPQHADEKCRRASPSKQAQAQFCSSAWSGVTFASAAQGKLRATTQFPCLHLFGTGYIHTYTSHSHHALVQ